jgi:SAM-dependent methyltransferase
MSEMQLEVTTCPVCDSADFALERKVRDRFQTIPDLLYDIVRCANCRLLYLNPRPAEADLGRFYESDAYDPFVSSRANFSPATALYRFVRFFTMRNKARRVCTGVKPGANVLDVGCATAELLIELRRRGYQCFGVEPDEGAATFARSKGLNVWSGDIQAVPVESEPYSLIVFWHVVEHIYHLRAALVRARELLADDGKIVIAVPNPKSLDCGWYGNDWVAWDTPRHLYHFEPDVMLNVLAAAGFQAERVGPVAFDAFYHCLLSEPKTIPGLVRAGARGMVSFLSGALGGKGSSELYVAHKA